MKDFITNSIKSLPPLPQTVIDVNRICSNKDASVMDLVEVLEKDPMIVANILKLANSPFYNFGREIKNISQAVGRFGMNMTRTIVINNSIRKLLNVDMKPYGVSSDKFAEISFLQSTLIMNWYNEIDKEKSDELYLASFLQEVGKILIANYIIQENESISFLSEINTSNNLAEVEKIYADTTSAEVTARIFRHWNFDNKFIDMIFYSDYPEKASQSIREYATALNIVKTVVSINSPLSEKSINFGLRKAYTAGYNHEILEDKIDELSIT